MSDTPGASPPAGTDGAETERPLRILIGADTFAPDVNGAARFAERLAAGLAERGHDVHIVAPAASRKHGTWKEVHEGQELTAHRLYSWRWYPHDWLRFALPWRIKQNSARILDEVKPDVVHFQSHIIVGRGLSVEVWGKKKIESMKLAGLLAVNRGSQEEPRFILMRYKPAGKPRKKIALVGKGITFDSGGLSLKPSKSMETMKLDMAGGAAIIATMSRLPQLRPDIEVTGYVPTTDNLPGANAQKPGDVIRYLNGKTIEVLNTDAEGRLILADALALAARQKPDYMINLATLTGACMVALGSGVGGLFSNNQDLAERLLRCSRDTGEKLWQLPLVKEYREMIKSSVADMKNIGGAHGGAITAALILQEFVADVPWAHLDIAGPAFAESDQTICPKGGTGFGVRTLLKFLSTL